MKRLFIITFTLLFSLVSNGLVQAEVWKIEPNFKKTKASKNISGAICFSADLKWCIAVNDEKEYAQLFSIKNNVVIADNDGRIRIIKDEINEEDIEPDTEAITFESGFAYITGSHGLSKTTAELQLDRFFVFKLPIDEITGKPKFKRTNKKVVKEIERSDRLRGVLKQSSFLGKYAETDIKVDGINIEGLTAHNGYFYFGLRNPVPDSQAIILKISIDCIFAQGDCTEKLIRVGMGAHEGVRDLVAVDDGLLILSGGRNESHIDERPATIWHWQRESGCLTSIEELTKPASAKAETLMLLERVATEEEIQYKALMLFESKVKTPPLEANFSISTKKLECAMQAQ